MSAVYEWIIEELQCLERINTHSNVVQTVKWRRKLIDGEYTAETYGDINVGVPSEQFVDYENLSQNVVISWIENILDVEGIDRVLQDNINTQKKPAVVVPSLPWANNTI